ncbi:type VII secretion protein EccE, partial [Streptomyces prunicolor]
MASGTRTRPRDRSRTRGSGTPGPGSAQPPSAAGASPQGPGGLHLRTRRGQGGAFRLQRLVLLELAAAVLLVGWAIAPMALVPAGVVAVALVLLAFVRRRGRSLPEWMGTARA